VTHEVLKEIGAAKVPAILVMNKTDLITDDIKKLILERKYPQAVMVSAFNPDTKERLIDRIRQFFQDQFFFRKVKLPYNRSGTLSDFYEHSIVENISYKEDAVYIDCIISKMNKGRFAGLI